nr:MAG TPA: hypothetical protein [Caudoviricetes sp.]
MKKENEFNTLIYVELPILVNRIMKIFCVDGTQNNELIANEIKRVVNAEIESAITTFKKLCS